jgi:hypothetical protein
MTSALAHQHAQPPPWHGGAPHFAPHAAFSSRHFFQPPLPPTPPPFDSPRFPGVTYVPVAVPAHLAAALQAQHDSRVMTFHQQPGGGGSGGRMLRQHAPAGHFPAALSPGSGGSGRELLAVGSTRRPHLPQASAAPAEVRYAVPRTCSTRGVRAFDAP